ncbi:hypothetical protein M758_9G103500 [Ceratodon purpureus]|nr:hypothetical protein M758_9G103500 [Ceratodon purpureus]
MMERTRFSRGRSSSSQPGCIQWSPFLDFQVLLWILLFTAHAPCQVLSERNDTNVINNSDSRGLPLWNETCEKIEGNCTRFHSDIDLGTLFFYWPEDSPLFHHCCTPYGSSARDNKSLEYKYSPNGEELQYAVYRDVGYLDQCLPFWKCQKTYLKIFETMIFKIYCEKTDLTRLYRNRFWTMIVWKYSLLQTVLPWIPILEFTVLSIAVAMFPWTWRLAGGNLPSETLNPTRKNFTDTSKIWIFSIWRRLLMDWGHLYLLAMIGNGLMEAMRRQSLYSIQSKVFFDFSMLYLILFIILSAASAMQQLAYWIGSARMLVTEQSKLGAKDDIQQGSGVDDLENGHIDSSMVCSKVSLDNMDKNQSNLELVGIIPSGAPGDIESSMNSKIIDDQEQYSGREPEDEIPICGDQSQPKPIASKKQKKELLKLSTFRKLKRSISRNLSKNVFSLDDNYKWQPIAAQTAICFTLWSFLTFAVSDDNEASNMWGTILGYIVTVGCLWTGIYSIHVFFKRAYYIFKFLMRWLEDIDLHKSSK